ncbi:TetR/AcrR family transcriptional regulator C-terminal domain-containing protein [Bacillus sp. FJAT-49732]|uniref:TetR/AcrR family transcriptional regulator C-terminal domain-containing protein n=1 Tax=Lederbergia citrisecunda TaxID=2833583 RepID=A0A942TQS0_9BACI|nr:TetR/AcrR family transcriptional regulator [Lederbergia citrisecunda]MBS4201181.1 TetR/AcrR family transcriptional regulator C-terminal domain-containing protein [Lederbergia citrisecunda]
MTNNEDRRSVRTQKKLKHALLELLKEKELNELSVTEVAQYAQCNRVTFYSHYKDLHTLLAAIFDDYLNELITYFRKSYQNLERFSSENEQRHLPLFEFMYQNQFVFSLIIKGEVVPGSQNQFCESLVQVSSTELRLGETTEIEIPALNYFLTYGSLGFFIYWIQQDFKDSPEVMAKKLSYLQNKMFKEAIVLKK